VSLQRLRRHAYRRLREGAHRGVEIAALHQALLWLFGSERLCTETYSGPAEGDNVARDEYDARLRFARRGLRALARAPLETSNSTVSLVGHPSEPVAIENFKCASA
jgi:hypothetical protein